MFENSVFINLLTRIYMFFSNQFRSSKLIQIFLTDSDNRRMFSSSIFNKLYIRLIMLGSSLFKRLGISRMLEGSLFTIPFLWCSLTVFFAPVLPTMLVLALSLASFLALFLSLLCRSGKSLRYYTINKYIYIYAFAYMYATISSVTLKGSLMGGLLSVFFMLFFTVVVNSIRTKGQLNAIMFLLVLAGVIVSLYGFYQFMFPEKYSGVWHDREMFESISFRVYSTLDNPNVLGEYFLLLIPLSFACFLNKRNIIMKTFFLVATGIMMLCLILTYSRGCYVGILVAFGVFLVMLDRRFILLGIFGLFLLPFILPETIINRFLSIGNMDDSSTSYRVYIWFGTIAMLKDYWLCGIGPGTGAFNLVYPAYAFNSISAPHSHNLFLQIICDAGVVGIVIFGFVLYNFYKALCAGLVNEHKRHNKIYIISSIASITGFLVQSMFDYTFYNYRVMLMFWIFVGLGIVFSNMSKLKD